MGTPRSFKTGLKDGRTKMQTPQIFAHRGAMAYRPQNTLSAFELAWSMGAHGVELDVQCTRDGEVMVFHDDTLDKLTNGTGRIRDYDAAELMTLDAGAHFSAAYTGTRIPTLAQVLRTRPIGRWVNIELKTELPDATPEQLNERFINGHPVLTRAPNGITERQAKRVAQRTAEVINHLRVEMPDLAEHLIVSSFHPVAIETFARLCPDIAVAYLHSNVLYHDTEPLMNSMDTVQLSALHLDAHDTAPATIAQAHQKGLQVRVWTVNDVAQARTLIRWGVDGLFTNVPDVMLALTHSL